MSVKARSSATSDFSGAPDWTATCTAITSGNALSTGSCVTNGHRYIQYQASLATTDTTVTPSLDSVTVGYNYYASGTLTSAAFDSTDPTNTLGQVVWAEDSTLPSGTTVTVSVQTAAASGGWTGWNDFTNATSSASSTCSKSSGTVTCIPAGTATGIWAGSNNRYFHYKVTETSTGASTPTVSSVAIQYVVNAAPQVQNVTAVQNANGTVSIAYEVLDSDTATGSVPNRGHITPTFQYWDPYTDGGSYQSMTTLSATSTTTQSVNSDGVTWTAHTAVWTPSTDYPTQFLNNTARVKVIADDGEGANRYGNAVSSTYTLDTKAPTGGSVVVDGSTSPATVTLNAADDQQSTLTMKVAAGNATLDGVAAEPYATSKTMSLSDPSTVYAQFIDANGNATSIYSNATPSTPTSLMIQDTSNVSASPAEYRLFLAWKAVTGPFASYKVYRATSNSGPWTLKTTIGLSATNYYLDETVSTGPTYYYKVTTTDGSGNVSFSNTVNGIADGTQSGGEGGGGIAPAPVISNVSYGTPTSTTATITWDTDTLSDSTVGYSTSASTFTSTAAVGSLVNNTGGVGHHEVVLSGLTPSTPYYFRVASTDINTLTTTDNSGGTGYTFTTPAGPAISSTLLEAVTNTTATISWVTDVQSTTALYYSIHSDLSAPVIVTGTSDPTPDHRVIPTGLVRNTKYYFYVSSTNGSGTETDKNVVNGVIQYYSFTTTDDSTAPTISGTAATASVNSVDIVWTTNEAADSQVEYGPTMSYGTATTLDTVATTRHYVNIGSLAANATYNYRVKSRDVNGNLTTGTNRTFTTTAGADIVAPVVSAVRAASVSLNGAIITWTTDENSNSGVDYGTTTGLGSNTSRLTDSLTAHSVTLTSLTGDTLYYFRVHSIDAAGNIGTDDNDGDFYTFSTAADVTAPVISLTSASPIITSADIVWTTNELANTQVEYGTSDSYGSSTTLDSTLTIQHLASLSGLTGGTTYHYRVKTRDASGNLTTGPDRTFVTLIAPDVAAPVISAVDESGVTLTSATVIWTTDEVASSNVEYGTAASLGLSSGSILDRVTSHAVTLTGLVSNTTYYYTVHSSDPSGNIGTDDNGGAKYTFVTVADTTAPTVTAVSAIPLQTSATILWTTSELANSQVESGATTGYGSTTSLDSTLTIQHGVIVSGLTGGTLYHYRVKTTDASGNLTTGSDLTFTTLGTPDTAAPIIGGVASSGVTATGATVTWTTNENSNSFVDYGVSTAYGNDTALARDNVTSHSITLSGLTSGTVYYYRVLSTDGSGNTGTDDNDGAGYTFTATPDTVKPVVSAVSYSASVTSASISWTTDKLADSQIQYGTTDAYGSVTTRDSTATIQHQATVSSLTANTAYHFNIKSTDASGNVNLVDDDTFTTLASADVAPPVISGVTVSGVGSSGATVTWTTSENSSSYVDYDTTTAFGSDAARPHDNVTSHSITLSGLTGSTRYYLRVVSIDGSGNSATNDNAGAGYTFTTEATPATSRAAPRETTDITPPSLMNLRVESVGQNSATVSWDTNESSDSLVKYGTSSSYGLFRGSLTESVLTHRVSITGLDTATTYHFAAMSQDASGNRAQSADMTFTTLGVGETAPPPAPEETSAPAPTPTENVAETPVTTPEKSVGDSNLSTLRTTLDSVVDSIINNNGTAQDTANLTQTVSDLLDRIIKAPTIVGVAPRAEVTGTTAIVRWQTDRKATSSVAYVKDADYRKGATNPYAIVAANDTKLTVEHGVEITNLDPATTYHYQVRSKALIGPEAASNDATFVTTSELPVISGLRIKKIEDLSATISWKTNVPTSVEIAYTDASTKVTLTQGDAGLLVAREFTVTNLSAGAKYSLTVKVKDEQGNETISAPLTFTTTADVTPPEITKVSAESTLFPGKDSRVQTIISWDTNELASSQVFYQEGLAVDAKSQEIPPDAAFVAHHTVVVTSFKPSTVYKYWIESKDPSGNVTRSKDFIILTPQQKATVLDVIINNFQQVFGWTKNLGL